MDEGITEPTKASIVGRAKEVSRQATELARRSGRVEKSSHDFKLEA